MKKHPVDDLFKRRLTDLERKPSSDAWQKIQQRSKTQRQPVLGWIWYAAASVVIGLTAGYIVWKNDANEFIHPGKSAGTIASAETKRTVSPLNEVKEDSSNEKVSVALETEKPANVIPSPSSFVNANRATIKTIRPAKKSESKDEQPLAAVTEKRQIDGNVSPVQEAPSIVSKIEEVKILPDEPAVSQVSKQDTEPTRTIVVAVETNASDLEDKPKNSRFSRVFRQLKNARAGERVDWDEVGFNPKSLVAKVDDRLHNREEKVSDKYQTPKERTKL